MSIPSQDFAKKFPKNMPEKEYSRLPGLDKKVLQAKITVCRMISGGILYFFRFEFPENERIPPCNLLKKQKGIKNRSNGAK